jgi:K+-H+ exchange-related protein
MGTWRIARVSGCGVLSADQVLEIYLIAFRGGRVRLFAPADDIDRFESESDDRIHRFLAWLQGHRWRAVAWLGRMLQSGRGYYVRLEARLDPVERVLKAMDLADQYVIFHSSAWDAQQARRHFFSRLRRQRLKHLFWCALDFVLSIASLAIAFLPGPNILGWYPFLRSLSHYRAFCGTRALLRSGRVTFKGLPELRTLEENLQAPGFDRRRIHAAAEDLKISGLEQFLERMT